MVKGAERIISRCAGVDVTAFLTRDKLLESYRRLGRARTEWLVGAEFERHLLDAGGAPLAYEPGVRELLLALAKRQGREVHVEGDNPIALGGPGGEVTLEPGGQFELSGTPFRTLKEVAAEATEFTRVVSECVESESVTQVAIGFTPFAVVADIPWVPKGRYEIMKNHLGKTGALAHHMMKGTCAVQASFDYLNEEDCGRKVRLAAGISPLLVAMYANSPYVEGRSSGFMSYRGWAWLHTDPQRTGLPDAAMDFSVDRWVDYLLDVPLLFQKTTSGWVAPPAGMTFRRWLDAEDGRPTVEDWALHQTSVFPEVRVKEQIEVRSADSVPMPLAMSLCAFWKGLFHSESALAKGEQVAAAFVREGTRVLRLEQACREGLRGQVGGRSVLDWSQEIYECALAGLEETAPDEVHYLGPLYEVLNSGRSPARGLLQKLGDEPHPSALLSACGLVEEG